MKSALSVVLILGSIMAVPLGAVEKGRKFKAGRAETYPNKSEAEKVVVAAVPFTDEEEIKSAFGKANMRKHGILPVLVVIDNNTGKAIRVDAKCELVFADGQHIANTPASDVPYLGAPKRRTPGSGTGGLPLPIPIGRKKNDLMTWEIEGRAFNTKLIPPGESASGFFYFQAEREPEVKVYLTGLSDAASGKEFFYWEIPLK